MPNSFSQRSGLSPAMNVSLKFNKDYSRILKKGITALLLIIASFSSKQLKAQATTLSQGDLSFVGVSGVATTPKLAFVTWVQLGTGTTIKFTDNTFNSSASNANVSGNANTSAQGVLYWTATSTVTAGTVITIAGTTSAPTASTGTASIPSSTSNGGNGFWSIGNGGRTIWAYQYGTTSNTDDFSASASATATYAGSTGSLICAIVQAGSGLNSYFLKSGSSTTKSSYVPADFDTTYSVTGLSQSGSNVRSAYYNGSTSGFATLAAAKASVNTHNGTNWGTYLGPSDNTVPTYVSSFTLPSPCSTPTITLGSNPSVCNGTTSAGITYSATTNSPNQYSVSWSAAAIIAGFTNVSLTSLPSSPISLTVPSNPGAGTYTGTLFVKNACGLTSSGDGISVTVNALPTITLGSNPSVCNGTTSANLTYSATTNSPDKYGISWSAGAIIAGFTNVNISATSLPSSPISITVPSNPGAGTYGGTLTVRNTTTGCTSTGNVMNVKVNALPTITLGSNPSVCNGTTSANLTYSATTSSPDQYSISWSAAAIIAGFSNVSATSLPASPISLTVPSNPGAGTYSGTLRAINSTTGCSSSGSVFSVTVNGQPTITLGSNPSVCNGTTSANLTYSATTGSPNQYSISWSAAAIIAGFSNVSTTSLPASPISLTVPSNPGAGIYTGTLTVTNSTSGCSSSGNVFSVTINGQPTITLGSNPSVCNGTTSANLTYSATTSSPDQYNISWSAAAIIAGFSNVSTNSLPSSPISLTVPSNPGAGSYTGTLTVTNSITGCSSSGNVMGVTVNALPTAFSVTGGGSYCTGGSGVAVGLSNSQIGKRYQLYVGVSTSGSPIMGTGSSLTFGNKTTAGTYTVIATDTSTLCTNTMTGSVTVTANPLPTITLGASPSVTQGTTTAGLPYTATNNSPVTYTITWSATALGAGFTNISTPQSLPSSPISITVPSTAPTNTYVAAIRVQNATCNSSSVIFTVTVTAANTAPTFTNSSPQTLTVCQNASAASINSLLTVNDADASQTETWSVTSSPSHGTLGGFPATASSGSTSITPTGLTYTPANGYSGSDAFTIQVSDGTATASMTVNVTVNGLPTITLGSNPSVCNGATSANLTYSATTNSPDKYNISWSAAAIIAGFSNVSTTSLPSSPIGITVPGNPGAGSYAGTLIATNSTTGCSSTGNTIGITVNALPDITLGTSPSVVEGSTSADLPYTGTIGGPTTYTITYDAAALTAGFVNVSNVPLTSSPIVLAVPPGAAPGVYNGMLTVSNGTCSSVDPDFTVTILGNTAPSFTNGNPLPLSVCQDAGLTSINNLLQVDDIDAGQQETWSLTSAAVHGTAFISYNTVSTGSTLTPSTLNYIPDGGYFGPDSFNVQISDGIDSAVARVNVTVNASPTITLGSNPFIGGGTTIANLPYTATTGSPTSYTVTYDADAITAGFANVSTTALPLSPIALVVPGSAAWQIYNGSIVVSNGCSSSPVPFTITVNDPLPVTLVSFNAFNQGNSIQAQWVTSNEINTDKFILEKSNGGIAFNAIAEISAKDAANNNYSFTDNDPNEGANLYRLKIIDKSGFVSYSTIISVTFKVSTASIRIYPNPGNIKSFKLKMMNADKGKYMMQVFNVAGLLVHKATMINAGSEQSLRLPATLAAGTYTISLQNGQTTLSQKIIVQ